MHSLSLMRVWAAVLTFVALFYTRMCDLMCDLICVLVYVYMCATMYLRETMAFTGTFTRTGGHGRHRIVPVARATRLTRLPAYWHNDVHVKRVREELVYVGLAFSDIPKNKCIISSADWGLWPNEQIVIIVYARPRAINKHVNRVHAIPDAPHF